MPVKVFRLAVLVVVLVLLLFEGADEPLRDSDSAGAAMVLLVGSDGFFFASTNETELPLVAFVSTVAVVAGSSLIIDKEAEIEPEDDDKDKEDGPDDNKRLDW